MKISRHNEALFRLFMATLGLTIWASWNWLKPIETHKPIAVVETPLETLAPQAERPTPPPPMPPAPQVPRVLEPDQAKIAAEEEELDAVSRDRARAESRAADADHALQAALARSRAASTSVKTLAYKVRDPSTRIAQASSKGGFLKSQRDKLEGEVAAISSAPRPKGETLSAKSAVARPTRGKEYHFEIRHDRVTVIDLERMLELIKVDARMKMRMGNGRNGVIASTVGPVGAFSLRYELQRAMGSLEDLIDPRAGTYDLGAWELVAERENRGETYEVAHQQTSEYGRAVRRLSPSSTTITMWVYPDGFKLYRKLRDELHAQGFLVAARPMPEPMTIRGSPSGSLSAGQ